MFHLAKCEYVGSKIDVGFRVSCCICIRLCVVHFFRTGRHKKQIQGDSEGICTTLGNDSMSDSKQKSSYEHGSDFERLRSYDRLKLGIEGNNY